MTDSEIQTQLFSIFNMVFETVKQELPVEYDPEDERDYSNVLHDENFIKQMTLQIMRTTAQYQYVKDELRSLSENGIFNEIIEKCPENRKGQ